MEMVINDKLKPQLTFEPDDTTRTPELEQDFQQAMQEYNSGETTDLDTLMAER